jgi:dienelactone hydrolase
MDRATKEQAGEHLVRIPIGPITLEGTLDIPEGARALVLFAHGSGSGRYSPRNRYVARVLRDAGLATLLMDLLTAEEDAEDRYTAHLRFDISLLAERLVGATDWQGQAPETADFRIGYFGASTGAAGALVAVAQRPDIVDAVVSRGGRPDLAGPALPRVRAPTLLIVGGDDEPVITLNRQALVRLGAREKQLVIVPGATHLFEEPGALEEVARLASDWLTRHLSRSQRPEVRSQK